MGSARKFRLRRASDQRRNNRSIQPAATEPDRGDRAGSYHDELSSRTENRLADRVAAPTDQVVLVGERPGKLWVRANASQRRLLIVADSFHPGWVATIDGQSTTLVRAEGDFIGCWVPAGSHEISFRFEPAGLWWGKRLSLLGMGLALVCYGGPFVAARCRQRRYPESVSNSLTTSRCTSAEAMATNDL